MAKLNFPRLPEDARARAYSLRDVIKDKTAFEASGRSREDPLLTRFFSPLRFWNPHSAFSSRLACE